MSDRDVTALSHAPNQQRLTFNESIGERSLRVPGRALNDREILLSHQLPISLNCFLDRGTPGEKQQARGLPIQAMDDKRLLLSRFDQGFQIVIQKAMGSLILLAIRAHREQSGGFVDNHDGVVEVNDLESETIGR